MRSSSISRSGTCHSSIACRSLPSLRRRSPHPIPWLCKSCSGSAVAPLPPLPSRPARGPARNASAAAAHPTTHPRHPRPYPRDSAALRVRPESPAHSPAPTSAARPRARLRTRNSKPRRPAAAHRARPGAGSDRHTTVGRHRSRSPSIAPEFRNHTSAPAPGWRSRSGHPASSGRPPRSRYRKANDIPAPRPSGLSALPPFRRPLSARGGPAAPRLPMLAAKISISAAAVP